MRAATTRYSTRITPPGARLVIATLAVLFLCQLHSSSTSYGVCHAREIEATREWTVIGENDTVASGMHVRIDMTTGEKWVKLMSDDDETAGNKALRSVHIEGDGAIVAVDDDDDDDDELEKYEEEPNYDFDMMHRTLAQLPEEEKERIGLPEKPEATTKKEQVTPEQRTIFEQQMKELWERRQEELRKFNEDNLADLPAILKDRIQRIRDYLVDPHEHLVGMDLEADGNENQVSHIVSVLVDLEYHLSDIDMTRDFYTLGGWPLLLSLMSAEVHMSSNQTDTIMPDDLLAKVHVIQAHAAWAIGTAVKNTGEFIPYAVEEILIGNHVTTAVNLMLAQFAAASEEHIQSVPVVKKLQKVVYALGSLLRNNRPAQVHFCASGGPSLLGTTLTSLIEEGSPHTNKMTKRLLMLADDIVSEVKLIEEKSKSPQVDEAIMQAFSTDQWCQLAVLALQGDPTIYETALLTVATLAGHCSWDTDVVRQAIFQIRDEWKAESDMDPDILKERLQLIESTMTLLTTEDTKQSLYSADY